MPFPAPPYRIDTARCFLRVPDERDLPALYAIHSMEEVNRYLPYALWTAMADADAWLARARSRLQNEEALQFAIIDKTSDAFVGSCVLFRFDREQGLAEIGYALGKPFWGKGYMREVLPALIRYAFRDLDVRRLEASVDSDNLASHRLLLDLGFEHEGMRRKNWINKGRIVDSNIYGLLRNEYRSADNASDLPGDTI